MNKATEMRKTPDLPGLEGRELQLFWSAAAEFELAGELTARDNFEYIEVFARLMAQLERDVKLDDNRLVAQGLAVAQGACRQARLSVPAFARLMEMIGLDMSGVRITERALTAVLEIEP